MPHRPRVLPVLDEVRRRLVHVVEYFVVEGELPGVVKYEGQDDADQRVAEEGQDPEERALEEDTDHLEKHDATEAEEYLRDHTHMTSARFLE